MFQQSSVASYFGKRKRVGGEDVAVHAKKIALDVQQNVDISKPELKCSNTVKQRSLIPTVVAERKPKTGQPDIRASFQKVSELNRDNVKSKYQQQVNEVTTIVEEPVIQNNACSQQEVTTTTTTTQSVDIIKSANELVKRMKEQKQILGAKKSTVTSSYTEATRKELSLGDIKMKLLKSSRLNELKDKMNKFNNLVNKKEISTPEINKFDTLEFDIPKSPVKSKLYSPVKSPVKPAYQRYSSLVEQTCTLVLPYNYQRLFELFQAVDTVCSMLINRRETVTFSKLKPAVQEMTRKNLSEHHLGQMATVLPNAFQFRLEKLRNFGSTSKVDKYELVISPCIDEGVSNDRRAGQVTPKKLNPDDIIRNADKTVMTPNIIKHRRQLFHAALLEKTKDYHEEFLQSLEPPVLLARQDVRRWHPNFMVDHVPSFISKELPQPPECDKLCSARDVLERARNFLKNPRLHKALETTSQAFQDKEPVPVVSEEQKEDKIPNPLKGIPKALLDKIKARQAAKAVETMCQSREDQLKSVLYIRLPETARILRTCFIDEQKSVLSRESLVDKIRFSSKSNLSSREVEASLDLLLKTVPDWLSKQHVRKTDYVKINKSKNIPEVMSKLEKLVADKNKF